MTLLVIVLSHHFLVTGHSLGQRCCSEALAPPQLDPNSCFCQNLLSVRRRRIDPRSTFLSHGGTQTCGDAAFNERLRDGRLDGWEVKGLGMERRSRGPRNDCVYSG